MQLGVCGSFFDDGIARRWASSAISAQDLLPLQSAILKVSAVKNPKCINKRGESFLYQNVSKVFGAFPARLSLTPPPPQIKDLSITFKGYNMIL